MADFIDGVRTFNLAAGRTEDRYDPRAVSLHIGLQLEELSEALEAICDQTGELPALSLWKVKALAETMHAIGLEFKGGMYSESVSRANKHDLLDASVDLMVVTVGGMMSQGADTQGACQEVNKANLSKLVDGKAIFDANGKIQKPPGWKKPDLAPFVGK